MSHYKQPQHAKKYTNDDICLGAQSHTHTLFQNKSRQKFTVSTTLPILCFIDFFHRAMKEKKTTTWKPQKITQTIIALVTQNRIWRNGKEMSSTFSNPSNNTLGVDSWQWLQLGNMPVRNQNPKITCAHISISLGSKASNIPFIWYLKNVSLTLKVSFW